MAASRTPNSVLEEDAIGLGWRIPDELTRLRPGAAQSLARANARAWEISDPTLLELVRLRLAFLLGNERGLQRRAAAATAAGLTEHKIAQLAQWPTSPLYTERERDCLSFVEQSFMDVARVDDEMIAVVGKHFSPGDLKDFVTAVYLIESTQRLEMASDVLLASATPAENR